MEKVDVTIIGAGVVGLAIAAKLSEKFKDIIVLERNEKYGMETSSRNSEVIHSGIYYPQNSLKTKLCVDGRKLLYEFSEKYNVPHKKTGKLIIAADESEYDDMLELYNNGLRNGLENIRIINAAEIKKIEPSANGYAAIFLEDTGIIDSHSLMKQLYFIAESKGALFCFNNTVNHLQKKNSFFEIGIAEDDYKFQSQIVINTSGLEADKIAQLCGINITEKDYKLNYCKGSYFSYSAAAPVKTLIYPIPHKNLTGLGVHITIDLAGRMRFGPDTEFIDKIDYSVDINKRKFFFDGAVKLIGSLNIDLFNPDCAGVRPKLSGNTVRDFIIVNEKTDGLDGLINLIGIESPGLTASLAIAEFINKMLEK